MTVMRFVAFLGQISVLTPLRTLIAGFRFIRRWWLDFDEYIYRPASFILKYELTAIKDSAAFSKGHTHPSQY